MGKFDHDKARARMRELMEQREWEQMSSATTGPAGQQKLDAEAIHRAARMMDEQEERQRRMQEFQQHMMGSYHQHAARAMAHQFDAQMMNSLSAYEQADAADDEWIEAMREGSTLTHEQAKMLGWLVKLVGSAEQAAEELRSCMHSQSYHDMWTDRIEKEKRREFEKRWAHPSLGTLAQGYGAGVATGRRVGKSQQFAQMYGAANLRPGAVWVVDDEEPAKAVMPLPERDPPKSAGDSATRSLRDNFAKYNPFKRKG